MVIKMLREGRDTSAPMARVIDTSFLLDRVRTQTYCDMCVHVTDVCDCEDAVLFYIDCTSLRALTACMHECECGCEFIVVLSACLGMWVRPSILTY